MITADFNIQIYIMYTQLVRIHSNDSKNLITLKLDVAKVAIEKSLEQATGMLANMPYCQDSNTCVVRKYSRYVLRVLPTAMKWYMFTCDTTYSRPHLNDESYNNGYDQNSLNDICFTRCTVRVIQCYIKISNCLLFLFPCKRITVYRDVDWHLALQGSNT